MGPDLTAEEKAAYQRFYELEYKELPKTLLFHCLEIPPALKKKPIKRLPLSVKFDQYGSYSLSSVILIDGKKYDQLIKIDNQWLLIRENKDTIEPTDMNALLKSEYVFFIYNRDEPAPEGEKSFQTLSRVC